MEGPTTPPTSSPGHLDVAVRLAVDRTGLAHERTLMAWVRTAVSLISFGFTIYKLFQFELKGQAVPPGRLVGPPQFALMMIAIGLVALVVATTGYRRSMRAMRAEFGHVPIWTATVVAALVSLLGIVAFVAVMFRA